MGISYNIDVVGWANEQAVLLRAGKLDAIDAQNIAEEIESVARGERRELGNELVQLIEYLLQWKFQSGGQCGAWRKSITVQRCVIRYLLQTTPSLTRCIDDDDWLALLWMRGAAHYVRDTGLEIPQHWLWSPSQALDEGFWPD